MEYRRLGSAGIKVSALSFGSWVTFGPQLGGDSAYECMKIAYDAGINFFDNAEVYAKGASETIMGEVFKKSGWRRSSYLVSTKLFWGIVDGVNEKNTLNRKYLFESLEGSLKRLQLEYVDLLFCHRYDPETSLEEVAFTMDMIVRQGKALYWGTSEWPAEAIARVSEVCKENGLIKPQMEQPQYNLFVRTNVEIELASLYKSLGLGTTIWSPLASGVLTGKYLKNPGAEGRLHRPGYEWLKERYTAEQAQAVQKLVAISNELDCLPSQLAIAWTLKNPHVSTAILGASSVTQLQENLKSIQITKKLTDEVMRAIEEAFPENVRQ
jgi:voltage-dependent potassium channel beta subunit